MNGSCNYMLWRNACVGAVVPALRIHLSEVYLTSQTRSLISYLLSILFFVKYFPFRNLNSVQLKASKLILPKHAATKCCLRLFGFLSEKSRTYSKVVLHIIIFRAKKMRVKKGQRCALLFFAIGKIVASTL